ncbi:MAG: hypothetical protein ACT4OI_04395, partial [Methanobacteriota archaeon]
MTIVTGRRALVMALVGLTVTAAFVGALAGSRGASASTGAQPQAAARIDYEFYDFFNVPYGEWWDYRTAIYGDRAMNAECFSHDAVANGLCQPSRAGVKDVATYPYTSWYPSPGDLFPGALTNNPFLYAPLRMSITGVDVTGYSLASPVFLPVLNAQAPAGTRLEFDWHMQYMNGRQINDAVAAGCPIDLSRVDGFIIRSNVELTMDLAESRRVLNVVAANAAEAQAWWANLANVNPDCSLRGSAETALRNWFVLQGGSSTSLGLYDISSSFEWFYVPFVTNMYGTVDADGTTHVTIDHIAWGTEVLLSRWFYWGATPYMDPGPDARFNTADDIHNYLDSSRAAGWWGMELAWFEDFSFTGALAASNFDFHIDSAMQYQFWQLALPGPNGQFDRTDDIPYWQMGPVLTDYSNDWSTVHYVSELDRYPMPPYAYVHTSAGSPQYGQSRKYDYTPIHWNLRSYESFLMRFPQGDVVFYDPNLTAIGADPTQGQYVEIRRPLVYMNTLPANLGTWDAAAKTWTVRGPTTGCGRTGTPGPDGTPGTADDTYALEECPQINLGVGAPEAAALLRVTTNPAVPGKVIVDGVARDEWGLTWMKIAPGPHTVTFSDLSGLAPPAPIDVTATAGQTTVAQGDYTINGYLRVLTEGAGPGTIFVNGQPNNDWGMWREAAPGTYTVSFGPVAGFNPPATRQVTVVAGATATTTGVYTSNPSAPGPDPNSFGYLRVTTSPAWPSTILVNGVPRDDWGLTWVKMAPGTYTVSFATVYGATPPPPT